MRVTHRNLQVFKEDFSSICPRFPRLIRKRQPYVVHLYYVGCRRKKKGRERTVIIECSSKTVGMWVRFSVSCTRCIFKKKKIVSFKISFCYLYLSNDFRHVHLKKMEIFSRNLNFYLEQVSLKGTGAVHEIIYGRFRM